MITPRAIRTCFSEIEPYLPFVLGRVKETLVAFADSRGYAVLARTKTLESISEKIETGRFKSWSEIDDFVACAVVIPTVADEDEVLQFLRSAFKEVKTVLRGTSKKSPDVFRFECTRFIATLRRLEDMPESVPTYDIQFEVQIRTAFEHAWIVTTHGLSYKTAEVSYEHLRLAAQLKATVEQLDMLVAGFTENAKLIPRNSWPDIDLREAIAAYFQTLFAQQRLPPELRPKDWTRFAENLVSVLNSVESVRRKSPEDKMRVVSETMERTLLATPFVSLNLSLFQFTFSILVTEQVIRAPLSRYTPVVTAEMEELYPAVLGMMPRFNLQD